MIQIIPFLVFDILVLSIGLIIQTRRLDDTRRELEKFHDAYQAQQMRKSELAQCVRRDPKTGRLVSGRASNV
jgi:hypothetical protein